MISNTYANEILNMICGVSDTMTMPANLYMGLCSDEPTASTGAVTTEPTAASYARKVVGGSTTGLTKYFGSASGGIITNSKEIQFNTAREAFGTQKYWFLSESATGNAILWGKLFDKDGNEGLTINAETVPVFYEGELKASIDVALS